MRPRILNLGTWTVGLTSRPVFHNVV